MRYEGTRESKGSDKSTVHLVALGEEELRLIHDLTLNAYMNTQARVLAFQPTRQRLNSMRKTTGEILGLYMKKKL